LSYPFIESGFGKNSKPKINFGNRNLFDPIKIDIDRNTMATRPIISLLKLINDFDPNVTSAEKIQNLLYAPNMLSIFESYVVNDISSKYNAFALNKYQEHREYMTNNLNHYIEEERRIQDLQKQSNEIFKTRINSIRGFEAKKRIEQEQKLKNESFERELKRIRVEKVKYNVTLPNPPEELDYHFHVLAINSDIVYTIFEGMMNIYNQNIINQEYKTCDNTLAWIVKLQEICNHDIKNEFFRKVETNFVDSLLTNLLWTNSSRTNNFDQ
jgi:hypothetical protein